VDGSSENKDMVEQLAADYGIKRVVISAYNSKVNGMIERGHLFIVNTLAKMTDGGKGN
jgi:transposase InsO family protein